MIPITMSEDARARMEALRGPLMTAKEADEAAAFFWRASQFVQGAYTATRQWRPH